MYRKYKLSALFPGPGNKTEISRKKYISVHFPPLFRGPEMMPCTQWESNPCRELVLYRPIAAAKFYKSPTYHMDIPTHYWNRQFSDSFGERTNRWYQAYYRAYNFSRRRAAIFYDISCQWVAHPPGSTTIWRCYNCSPGINLPTEFRSDGEDVEHVWAICDGTRSTPANPTAKPLEIPILFRGDNREPIADVTINPGCFKPPRMPKKPLRKVLLRPPPRVLPWRRRTRTSRTRSSSISDAEASWSGSSAIETPAESKVFGVWEPSWGTEGLTSLWGGVSSVEDWAAAGWGASDGPLAGPVPLNGTGGWGSAVTWGNGEWGTGHGGGWGTGAN
ncbi:hypothetical protein DFH06DRAFT_1140693 [Mycena polygramma]|nr:hypothetical protein DFH06DRAFT_1140693 [Mycena polygramma]